MLYLIGNAHIDPVWLWQWPEGYHEVLATFRSALDRLAEDPEFVFSASSAAFYGWVEQTDPAMFREIQERVDEGRWQLVGGWWVEPDCNIPGGESLVRHGLYGQRYFQARFGKIATAGYNPDSFGHSGMLPQILSKSGMRRYLFLRPSHHEQSLPGDAFWWEADDGSRVLAYRIPYEYCSWPDDIERQVRRVAAGLKPPLDRGLCFYGVGNHGGGPTRANLACLHGLAEDVNAPQLIFAGPDRLLEWVEQVNNNTSNGNDRPPPESQNAGATSAHFNLKPSAFDPPTHHGDLQHHASGCYAAHSGVKRWNRRAENALLAAEKWAAVASWVTDTRYPADELTRAWQDVLFNQFHDILAGSSLEAAYTDAQQSYGAALAAANRALNSGMQALAWRIHIPPAEETRPLVVFNPHAWPSRVPVQVEFGSLAPEDILLDDADGPVPMQTSQSGASTRNRHRLNFIAHLPPLGYRVYRVAPGPTLPAREAGASLSSPDSGRTGGEVLSLETPRLRLTLDPATGCIASLYDKSHNTEVFLRQAAQPVVIDDPSDTWGHNVYRFDRVIGAFAPHRIRLIEDGPVKSVLRVESLYEGSTLVQDFTVYQGLDQVDVAVSVDWHGQHQMLKLRFPANIAFQKVTAEIPYGHIERFANGDEQPGQSWVDVSGESRDTGELYGVSILNDGKYSFDVNLRDIGLTVLRSPIYAHHIPYAPQPDRDYTYMDQGLQRFTYTILPHAGSWEDAGTVRRAAELNERPAVLPATFHTGAQATLPQSRSFLSVDRDNIVVNVLKQAEDGAGMLIVRAYEAHKMATHARIYLPFSDRVIETDFGPCEIKTFRIARDRSAPVEETDLLEWTLDDPSHTGS